MNFSTHHSEVVIHGLEGAAKELARFRVSDLADTSTVLRVPDTQRAVQRRRHDDVVAKRPGEVSHGTRVPSQRHPNGRGRRGQSHDRQGPVQGTASEEVLVVVGELQARD